MDSEQWARHGEEVMQWLREAAGVAQEQAPLVVQELLRWGLIYNVTCGIVGSLLVVALAVVVARLFRAGWATVKKHGVDEAGLEYCGGALFAILCTVIFCITVERWLLVAQVLFAPRVYLLERIAGLLAGGS